MKISDANKHIGQTHRAEVVARCQQFQTSYRATKVIVRGLIADGEVSCSFILSDVHKENILKVFPPIEFRGTLNQTWVII